MCVLGVEGSEKTCGPPPPEDNFWNSPKCCNSIAACVMYCCLCKWLLDANIQKCWNVLQLLSVGVFVTHNASLQIEPLEKEARVVADMYELIERFTVPTPPEDFAVYQTLNPSIHNVLNCIDKSLAERDSNVDKFCTHVDKDIAELHKEVKEVKQESQVGAAMMKQFQIHM